MIEIYYMLYTTLRNNEIKVCSYSIANYNTHTLLIDIVCHMGACISD